MEYWKHGILEMCFHVHQFPGEPSISNLVPRTRVGLWFFSMHARKVRKTDSLMIRASLPIAQHGRKKMKKIILIIMIVCFQALSVPTMIQGSGASDFNHALSWGETELVIDSDEDIGLALDLCAGQGGDFHLLFQKEGSYWYGKRTGTSWNTEGVTLLSYVQSFFSLSVQENHAVGVSYNSELPALVTTNNASGQWIATEPIPGTDDASAIDTCSHNGNVHIFWCQDSGKLFHTCSDQGVWQTVQIGELDSDTSRLAVAAHPDPLINDIHFAWYDSGSKTVEYAVRDESGYHYSTVQAVESCRWVSLGVLDPGVPYIGFLEIRNQSERVLQSAYFIDPVWQSDILVVDESRIETPVMTLDPFTGISYRRVYFAYAADDGYVYRYRSSDESWNRGVIEPLGHLPVTLRISLAWDSDLNRAGLVIGQKEINEIYFLTGECVPEMTPTPVPTSTPSPDITLGVTLDMPSFVHPGEDFQVTGELWNIELPITGVPVCFLFQVYDDFWFWPDWFMNGFTCQVMDIPSGVTDVEVIPSFVWPDTGSQSLTELWFYGAMLTPDMTGILGEFAAVPWGFGPE